MSRKKTERNELILELADKGYIYKQILEKLREKGFTGLKDEKSVGMQLSRLRKGKKVITTPSKQITKAKNKQSAKAPSKQVYQRATYHLTKEQIRDLNILAAKREVQRSALIRQIVTEYLSKQNDL